jgi:hypothetical protein
MCSELSLLQLSGVEYHEGRVGVRGSCCVGHYSEASRRLSKITFLLQLLEGGYHEGWVGLMHLGCWSLSNADA